jgi:hypothetical protein
MIIRPGPCDEQKLDQLLNDVDEIAVALNDELLLGYVFENRARIETRKKKYLQAGRAFGEAACHLAKRTGLEARLAFDRLHNELLDDVLNNEERDELARGILEKLSKEDCEDSPALMALKNMCDEILASPM